eukprot:6492766-Amphidinium_carterae.2
MSASAGIRRSLTQFTHHCQPPSFCCHALDCALFNLSGGDKKGAIFQEKYIRMQIFILHVHSALFVFGLRELCARLTSGSGSVPHADFERALGD